MSAKKREPPITEGAPTRITDAVGSNWQLHEAVPTLEQVQGGPHTPQGCCPLCEPCLTQQRGLPKGNFWCCWHRGPIDSCGEKFLDGIGVTQYNLTLTPWIARGCFKSRGHKGRHQIEDEKQDQFIEWEQGPRGVG